MAVVQVHQVLRVSEVASNGYDIPPPPTYDGNGADEFFWIQSSYAIMALTNILAYLLSEKVPPGTATKRDSVFMSFKSQQKFIEKIINEKISFPDRITKFYNNLESDISDLAKTFIELKQKQDLILNRLEIIPHRESALVTIAAVGLYELRIICHDVISKDEIRAIIDIAELDLKDAGYDFKNKSASLKNILAQHIEDDACFKEGPIKRIKTSMISYKELREMEETGSRKSKIYQDEQ